MTHLPHLTVLLSILAEPKHKDGLTPDQMLKALADKGTVISRPTLNRVLVAGREAGKLVADGLTTGRTYRLVEVSPEAEIATGVAIEQPAGAEALAPDRDIVSAYASRVWATADVLRGVGVRQGEWPGHMMPFFAVMLLESRVLRVRIQAMVDLFEGGKTFDRTNPDHLSDLKDYYIAHTPGTNNTWHEGLLLHGEGMRTIAQGGAAGILGRLNSYLAGYDTQTQRLIGFGDESDEKYLGIKDTIRMLASKGSEHLAQWVIHWAQVDLTAYDSAAITTLEEHVKRRWAEWDSATAGEHYTPYDLIHLVVALAEDHVARHPFPGNRVKIYDPTCGGGNMLFGVADRLKSSAVEQGKHLHTKTLGQEINDTLYALAAVESRFREDSDIRHGNTLTADQFTGEEFDLIVANPPYGVDWKSIVKDIDRDETGRFPAGCRPPTSDGQHLFLQHIQAHLAEHGLGFVFCSGSTLFSGNAGGGESNARLKYFQTDDNVLGIIQLPKDEFFNTGISTYLWIFKRNKPESMKGRAFFLDASSFATKLRKSLGSKRHELNEEAIAKVVALVREAEGQADALMAPERREDGRREKTLGLALGENGSVGLVDTSEDSAHVRLLDVDEVCYNRLELELTKGDPAFNGEEVIKKAEITLFPHEDPSRIQRAPVDTVEPVEGEALVLRSEMELDEAIETVARFELGQGDIEDLDDRIQELQADPKTLVAAVKERMGGDLIVRIKDEKDKGGGWMWSHPQQPQERTLWKLAKDGSAGDMGRASLSVNARVRKSRKDDRSHLVLVLTFSQDTERDVEITPYSREEAKNKAFIEAFLERWVRDDHVILGQTTGCEVNFNRLFPATTQRMSLEEVNRAIADIDAQIAALHGRSK